MGGGVFIYSGRSQTDRPYKGEIRTLNGWNDIALHLGFMEKKEECLPEKKREWGLSTFRGRYNPDCRVAFVLMHPMPTEGSGHLSYVWQG